MFDTLNELMVGRHEELPRRRVTGGVNYDADRGGFVADEVVERESTWLGRGEVPGAPVADAQRSPDGLTVADEMRELASKVPR